MAGTDDSMDSSTGESVDDDALYVLTAALLTPAQFPAALGDDYPEACAALGVEPYPRGYGLIMGQDGDGARWTVVVDDVSLVAVAIASWDCGMEHDLSPEERSVVAALPGWPIALAVAAPGIPAPHDPEPEPGSEEEDGTRPPLVPPDTGAWGPAQRRLGADEIAKHWSAWREQLDNGTDAPKASPGATPSHGGVLRVLKELRGYVDTAPPPGRVRSGFAPDQARMLRADGPGWSFVARTDDIAFVLLDEEPGEVLPVGRGSELPGLLKALDETAVRPA